MPAGSTHTQTACRVSVASPDPPAIFARTETGSAPAGQTMLGRTVTGALRDSIDTLTASVSCCDMCLIILNNVIQSQAEEYNN